jgi:nitrate reductase NapE component
MMQMMNMGCGPFMAIAVGLVWLLGLALVGSLTVLVWVVIGRLRRTPGAV